MKALIPVLAALAVTAVVYAPAAAAEEPAAERTKIVTEFSGRPPFARKRVPVAEASLARFEETTASEARSTDFRGRPPFRRNVDSSTTATADFARFEEVDETDRRRSGPPGKNSSRR